MTTDLLNTFRISIEDYYRANKRSLPWRKEVPDPYEVWLSEIILQQTRVAQGTPYWEKILAAFPTIEALANAEEDKLMSLWTGLGYYNRARNLQKGAKQIVSEFEGEMPTTYDELLTITGIGPYTAAAIASICYDEKIGAVDGNVYRVLSRFFGISTSINQTDGIKEFQSLANSIISSTSDAASYNQGIMEFGALHCTPKKPFCMLCDLADICTAFKQGKVDELPVKVKKGKRGSEEIHYAIICSEKGIALRKRGTDGIWAGLYEPPRLQVAPKNGEELAPAIVHKLSHKDLKCHFWLVNKEILDEPITYYTKNETGDLGMPIIIANLVENIKI
ncbi:MAG TPA: A/G-specific adenine glycosylase [Cryomorphaceae bacterium]|nr:A/G-specific adenine glycosylase [Cryomorphaceae bacterium]|tara:strand:+ start:284 stop:1285 length:1002 start_codon:yes stop_codon:yes gene_type:complete